MALYTVTQAAEINKLQQQFMKKLQKNAENVGTRSLGFQGGGLEGDLFWRLDLGIWACFLEFHNRHWNGFGTSDPRRGSSFGITCEINFPIEGFQRSVAGVFFKDEGGDIFVGHRGRIGGGKPGIGKTYFFNEYRGDTVLINDGDAGEVEVALIGRLRSAAMAEQVADFVKEIDRIKHLEDSGDKPHESRVFMKEFEGEVNYPSTREISYRAYHGIITNSLESRLKQSGRTYNDRRDLVFTPSEFKKDMLFEVKTDATLGSIYAAIGQLFYYSKMMDKEPILVAVLPEDTSKGAKRIIRRLGIEVVLFDISDSQVSFKGLDNILKHHYFK